MPTMYTKNLQHYSYSAGINVYQSINNVTGNRFVFHKITFGQHKKKEMMKNINEIKCKHMCRLLNYSNTEPVM